MTRTHLTASEKSLFSKTIECCDIINYYQFRESFKPTMDEYFKDNLPSIYLDIKANFLLNRISIDDIKTKGYENVAQKNNIDLEYLFLYMFNIINPETNFLNPENVTEEEEKLISVYYEKYYEIISYIRSLIPDNYISGSGFQTKTPFKVNNKSYVHFKITPVSGIIQENKNVLYIHINGKNNSNLKNHVTLPINSSLVFDRDIKSIFSRGIEPSYLSLTDKVNDRKSKIIAKTRKEEKAKSLKNRLIAFKTNLNFDMDRNYSLSIENIRNKNFTFDINDGKLSAFYLILAKLDKNYLMEKLNLQEYEFNNFYLYLKNGKTDDYYYCEKNEDLEYMSFIPVTDAINLDSISSLYEEKLSKNFTDNGCYFLRDKELYLFYTEQKMPALVTPDFYFPDGIFVNGELCYWIELKRKLKDTKEQIERYIQVLGPGAIILEEGFNKKPLIRYLNTNIQILNGTY